ncbi:hypothetical protein AAG570_009430 [Ranatra chinensis]|uniref:Transmembrane protein 222 n=1 Tax=Ranatra chinensis TaxID=642074 RepID=A0ABD0YR76_9HEMI
MGIGTSSGVIRDFAGSYYVSEDNMAFGKPTKYWKLDPSKSNCNWDLAIGSAVDVYKTRTHNLCIDNCHSMVAMALNNMKYDNSCNWNMVKLAFYLIFYSKYVSFGAVLKSWLPFCIILSAILIFSFHSKLGF